MGQKVWILFMDEGAAGCGPPDAAFSSEASARDGMRIAIEKVGFAEFWEIKELELDVHGWPNTTGRNAAV
jgi:hypothetical protein